VSAPFVEYSDINKPSWFPPEFLIPTKAPEETTKEEMIEFENLMDNKVP